MRKKTKIQPYRIDLICDDCNEKMIKEEKYPTSIFTYPEKYKYKCPKCGKEELSFTLYPSIIFEDIKR